MQIVINIPDYPTLDNIQVGSIANKVILDAVKSGVVLPKTHGDLVDADLIIRELLQIYDGVSRPDLKDQSNFLKGIKSALAKVMDAEVVVNSVQEKV